VLNVKLVVKVVAVIIISFINWRTISVKEFFRQRYLFFYFGMICIGLINLALQYKNIDSTYLATAAIGLSFWIMSAAIAYNIYKIVQRGDVGKMHNTVSVFFALHIAVVFLNLLRIIIETGAINPYTYKGLNARYYVSTGDFITGVTFDAPVSTAFICALGLLYFLYRKQFLLSVACMAALIIMASNFANLILIGVFLFSFFFYSNKIQKSFILIYLVMLVVFMVRISPQNYEHVGRIFYQVIDKPYDLPPVKVIPLDQLKKEPDSILSFEDRRKKHAQNYIDSMNSLRSGLGYKEPENVLAKIMIPDTAGRIRDAGFYQFHESKAIEEKINRYKQFLNGMYSAKEQDSLAVSYNWKSPGKWIAGEQLFNFFKDHNLKILLGNGIANFSSRLAFKATMLNMAGQYPRRLKYINPDFLINHLYVYLYFHSQEQSKHEASNTPDAVYYQLAGEYGIMGVLFLLFLYFGFFVRRIHTMSYGLPLLLLLAGAFFAEYWFEQFSIVVLFELLFFLDMKDLRPEEQHL
jgi:cell division protein FtsW (lipid II flippase)